MMRARVALGVVLVFVLSLLASGIVSAGQTQVIGKWDAGASYDAIAYGNHLYVASGSQVRIYDISTKEKIENIKMECIHSYDSYRKYGTYKEKTPPVNILHTDAGTIRGMYADGNYLYVIGGKFVIADISDPENAYIVSSLDIGGKDVQVQGNYAYLITPSVYGDDITIVDISDKKNPVKVAGIDVESLGGDHSGLWRLYVEGNYLYTGDDNNYLYIIDISDPTNPTVISTWPNPGGYIEGPSSFAKKDNHVFVVRYHYGFYVIDVSDPANPVKVAEVIGMNNPNANDIKILGDYLFISTRYEGFRIYNISDPTNPSLVTTFWFSVGYAESIFVHELPHGTYVFETASSVGWAIINVTNIEHMKLMTDPMMPVPSGNSVKVKGNYAFVGAWNDAVWVLNVSDPTNPKSIAVMRNGGRNTGLEISEDGNYLYVAAAWSGLSIANISDPENPKWDIIDYGPDIGGPMVAVDNYLYVGGLRIYDVSDPKNPEIVYDKNLGFGSWGHPHARYGDDYLLCGGQNGFFIVDISNRTNPKVISNLSIDLYAPYGKRIDVSGGVAYVGSGNYLYSVDISDVTNPVILDKVNIVYVTALTVYGTYAYVTDEYRGLHVVNISNPSSMKVEETAGISATDIDEENGLLYTSKGHIFSPIGGGELPLQISLIKVSSITENSAIISWQTNKEADSLVKYGTSSGNYSEQKYDPNPTKYHSIKLENLSPNTTYYFVIESKTANETATSTEKSFKTKAPDVIPPIITIVSPENNSVIEGGTPLVNIKIETDEPAICQYSFSDFEYGEGTNFTQTGGTAHSFNLSVEDGKSYTLYYRCQDLSPQKNVNTESTIHSFSVATEWWDYFDDETKIESKENVEISSGVAKIKFPESKIYPTKDALITPEWMGWSTGKGDFGVGYFDRLRSLLEFEIPNGTGEIKSVRLHLYVSRTDPEPSGGYGNNTILMHILTKTFDEDDCDYKYRDKSENLTWDNEGGDFDPTVIDSLDVSGDLKGEWLVFTLKGAEAENQIDVKWGDTIGLILRPKITWGVYRADWFKSREASEEQRPYLEIIAGSTSAHLISVPITPTSLQSWDKFYADYETPEGTHISFSILDAETGEILCSNLTGKSDDISACLSGVQSIKLKAELRTDNPPATPILKKWRVSWITGRNDTTPPITTTEITPQPNERGWINSTPVVIIFNRSDDSDVAYTNYSFSREGSWKTVPGNDPFNITITDEGTFTIRYYSVDIFGNKESVKNITLKIDITPPSIKNITVAHANSTIIITWMTDEKADSLVKYGTSSGNYTLRKYNSSYVEYHRIVLSGLLPNTTYYFVVNSTDEAGNSNQSSEGSFLTPPTPPRLPPSETVTIEGKEKVDDAMLLEAATDYGYYPYIYIGKYGWRTCRGVLKFNLSSIPRNASILSAKLEFNTYNVEYNVSLNVHKLLASWEEYEVTWYNRNRTVKWENPGGDFGPAIETKSFNSSGKVVFECRKIAEVVQEWVNNPESNYGFLLEADAPEDKSFYIYQTDWNEKLAPKLVVTYELADDVSPPKIENVSVACTNNSATIEWDTDEISDSRVRYGTESGNYSYEAYDSAFVTHHNITIRGLESGRTYYFEVVSADMSGNKARSGEYKFKTRSSMPVTVVIGGENIEDAWLAKHLYFRNYGWYPWIYIGNTSYGISRGIIKFNLSSIPANSKIIQAKLIVKIAGPSPYGAPSNSSLSVHKVLNSWDEYEVTWDKRNKTENWNTSGGDFGPKIAEISNFSGHPTLVMNENITEVVKEWCEYPEKNYGFILEWDNAPEGKYFVIAQKEYYTEDAPKLEVTYMPPS
ncbi:MAG: DNRLRE domain-containing protein [Methanophagales archaeon]|nr:DNRLRE domain-containing protein [Methanophagales archaeon]